MKIVHISEKNKAFTYLCVAKAVENLPKYINCEVQVLDLKEWYWSSSIDPSVDIFIFEAASLQILNIGTKHLKWLYPNAKLVCLGSDTIYFTTTNTNNGYQFDSPHDCDLFLETMWDTHDEYKKRGIKVDHWDWTASEWLLDYVSKFEQKDWNIREYDFISVMSPHTINREGSYRKDMVDSIKQMGFNFTQGGGTGMDDNDYDKIFHSYCNSQICIGTSSHDNPAFYGRKGFRDAVAPFMGTVLIYDDFKDVVKDYKVGEIMPIYKYGNFYALADIWYYLKNNNTHREKYLELQKEFFLKNTIEKQLVIRFNDYDIVEFYRDLTPIGQQIVRDKYDT